MTWDKTKMNFDTETPSEGHQDRFENRLNEAFGKQEKKKFPLLKVAASVAILLGLAVGYQYLFKNEAAPLSAEIEQINIPVNEAEWYYKNSIEEQLLQLAATSKTPESKEIIQDCETAIQNLEVEYTALKKELKETGDQRVAAAMIENFKRRINILENLIQQINYVNQLKKENHDNYAS